MARSSGKSSVLESVVGKDFFPRGSASMKDEVSVNQLWKDRSAKPHEWWDIRLKKGNSTAAAFENKDNGQLLWINESTPEWIQKKLECLTFDPKIAPKSHKSVSGIKDDGDPVSNSWRDLVRNPKNWKDHRKNKLNNLLKPKHPDFKHKDSGVPLWLNTAPKWVLSGLDGLEFDVPLLNVKQPKGSKDGQYESIVQDIENMVRSYIGKASNHKQYLSMQKTIGAFSGSRILLGHRKLLSSSKISTYWRFHNLGYLE